MSTLTGQVVTRAIEIDSDVDCGLPPNLNEISSRVYAAVKMLRSERIRYQNELTERARDGRP
jgi:hypothetical protein